MTIKPSMVTDAGCVRSMNQDAVAYVSSSPQQDGVALAIVADGMGGHAAGEVASTLATNIVRQIFFGSRGSESQRLRRALEAANEAILEHARQHPDCSGMGTTCTAIAFGGDKAFLAHIGDSRAYLFRRGELTQLSEDHSLNAKLIRDGVLTAEEAARNDTGNIILQALGTRPNIDPLIWSDGLVLERDDRILLCSDGLTTMVDDARIAEVMAGADPDEACQSLLRLALRAGGLDNISVGIFIIGEPVAALDRSAAVATRRIASPGVSPLDAAGGTQ